MKKALLAPVALVPFAMSACAPPVAPLPGPPGGQCSADRLGNLVGQFATLSLVSRAKRRAGASQVRVLRPGQIVTMEFRNGRLNVNVDERNRVVRFNCG
jgi:hypothetical protein